MRPGFKQATRVLAKRLDCSGEQMLEGFTPAGAADLDAIVQWRKENSPEPILHDDHNYLRWRYNFGNNGGAGNRRSFLWVLKIKGELLGMMGAQHHVLHAEGEQHDIAYPLDLLVRKDLVGSGLGAWINLAMQQQYPVLLVIGSGTRESAGIIKRLFTTMPNRKIWKLPVSTEGTLRRLLPHELLARPASMVADSLLATVRMLRGTLAAGKHIRVEPVERFGEEIDELMAHWPRDGIYLDRNPDFLNWRFADNPGIDYQALTFYHGDRLVGYSVYRTYYSEENRQQQAAIDDLIWLRDSGPEQQQKLLASVMAALIQHLLGQKARLVIFASYGSLADKALHRFGFVRRDDEQTFAIYNALENAPTLLDAERWYLTSAEVHGPNF